MASCKIMKKGTDSPSEKNRTLVLLSVEILAKQANFGKG